MPGGHAGRVWEGQAAWGLTSALPGRGAIPQPSRASVHPGMGALSAATPCPHFVAGAARCLVTVGGWQFSC